MSGKNIYCSAMVMVLTMLLLSAVVYLVLGPQTVSPQKKEGRNNLLQVARNFLRPAPARRAQ